MLHGHVTKPVNVYGFTVKFPTEGLIKEYLILSYISISDTACLPERLSWWFKLYHKAIV